MLFRARTIKRSIGTCRKESKETMFFLRMVATSEENLGDEARKRWREAKELNINFGVNLEKVNDDKSEGRNPKPERSPKPGIRNRRAADAVFSGLRNSDFFRISTFGFRILLMLLARVEAIVVATRKHPTMRAGGSSFASR